MAAAIESIDCEDLLKGLPRGAWVAISETQNKVVGYGSDCQTAVAQAREQGEMDPLIVRVPQKGPTVREDYARPLPRTWMELIH